MKSTTNFLVKGGIAVSLLAASWISARALGVFVPSPPVYMPHGYCYLWNPRIVWVHVVSDSLIALSYYCIPIVLIYLIVKRHDLPFNWVLGMFGAFILACGTTHVMEVWNVWHGDYALAGIIKAITAGVSTLAAALLLPLAPRAMSLPGLELANRNLQDEIAERERAEHLTRQSLATVEAALNQLAEQQFALDQHAEVSMAGVDGRITYVNDRFCAISKYSRQELIGQNHRIVNSGHHPKEFFKQMYETIGRGEVWHGEVRNRAKNGEIYWSQTTIVPFLGPDGKPRQYTAIRANITERKQAEKARGLLAAVVESSDDAIITKTLDGVITAWNRGAEKVFGYSAEEIVGKSMLLLFPPERVEEEASILARIQRGESVQHFETVRVRKDGKKIDVSVTISPIRDSSEAIIGISKIARDITQRKQVQAQLAAQAEELSRQTEELKRSNADLEQFAYVASHDLQEPLRMVTAYTELLAERYRDKLDDNARKFIDYASEGALRMQVLIRDLLAFSRVGRKEDARTAVNCNEVVADVRRALAPAIQESGASITVDDLPTVWADRTQMAQVFQNLIGNAIKFRGKKSPIISVKAEKEKKEQEWIFSVSDNGIGIAPEFADNIFVIFQRLHRRDEYPGNGIGLAICKKIVERYGGKIWVESQPGSGSTFHFVMPVYVPGKAQATHA